MHSVGNLKEILIHAVCGQGALAAKDFDVIFGVERYINNLYSGIDLQQSFERDGDAGDGGKTERKRAHIKS